jgi:glycosyltransferase involved in cell wall biosynthesis
VTPVETEQGIVVGVDASRNRSGGAIRHLVGILSSSDPRAYGIREVHVWSHAALIDALPDAPWLFKHQPAELEGSIFRQVWWQRRKLPAEIETSGVQILLNTDAGTVCRFHPAVVMSRDMLSYEPGELRRYFISRLWLRILALRYVQRWSLRGASGAIFLTRYAADVIQRFTGPLPRIAIVPHGVGEAFRRAPRTAGPNDARPLRCLYVSTVDLYKHQWTVVEAVAELRKRGHAVELTLTGGGDPRAERLLSAEVQRSDPNGEFVRQIGFVRADALPVVLGQADIFVFASSCENMPNTLVEAMASGLPIACSNRGPMPEVLRDGGMYFDPEDYLSVASAIEQLLIDPALRAALSKRAVELAADYSWGRCAAETWTFLRDTFDALYPPGFTPAHSHSMISA